MLQCKRMLASALMTGMTMLLPSAVGQLDTADKSGIETIFARGVYWPWERLEFVATNAGLDRWDYADKLLASLHEEFHCNLVWIVNITMDDAVKMCDLAEKYGIQILPNINPFLNMTYHGFSKTEDIAAAAEEAARLLADKAALGAYVLRDEPRTWHAAQMEEFRLAMQKADPSRQSIVVTMNLDTETYISKTGFPIVCTDNYPFGGERSPNIPNPTPSSQNYYRNVVAALSSESLEVGKRMWVMPQIFADVWGPWWFDDEKQVVIEPGAYHHWRMPTAAETNWQIWEGLRSGCTGIVFYVLFGAGNRWDGTGEVPERMAKQAETVNKNGWPLASKQIRTGAGDGLLLADGTPTPQMRAMGETFGVLADLETVLHDMKPASFPAVFAAKPFAVNTFSASDGSYFAVVVNDDVEAMREERLYFLPHTIAVEVISSGETLLLQDENMDVLRSAALQLPPGAGAVLKLAFRDNNAGILLFDEDFSQATLGVKLEKLTRQPVRRGWGAGWDWIVQKEKELPPDTGGAVIIENISKPNGATGGVLASTQTQMAVYLAVEGSFSAPESLLVTALGPDGRKKWLRSNNYHLPVRVEQGTETIQVELSDRVSLDRLRLWAIPRGEER